MPSDNNQEMFPIVDEQGNMVLRQIWWYFFYCE